MTPKQKRTIAVLVAANVVVILALVMLVTRPPGTNVSPLPTPTLWVAASAPSSQSKDLELDPTARFENSTAIPPSQSGTSTIEVPQPGGCQWAAAQLLAQAGLGGTVVLLPDGLLRFEIVYPLPPGETADEAAQLVWTVFDVALALQEQADECDSLTRVKVAVFVVGPSVHDKAQGNQAGTQIEASVSAADLAAFGVGALSEEEFIERVTYTTFLLP